MVVMLGQSYDAVMGGQIDWIGMIATYIGIPLFLLLWWGYRLRCKTRIVPYAEMRFPTAGEPGTWTSAVDASAPSVKLSTV
jgi:lysine-specific permease